MGGRLYGQQALQEGFVPRLVGLHHKDGYLVPFAYPKGAPVVRIVGGRGSGKTALLGAVHDAYNGRVPLAGSTSGLRDSASPASQMATTTSPTPPASPTCCICSPTNSAWRYGTSAGRWPSLGCRSGSSSSPPGAH